jgi:septation ring formation regulator EzrA
MSEYNTQPTIQTLLEEMQKGFAAIAERFDEVYVRLDRIETRLDAIEARLTRIERRQSNQDATLDAFIEQVIEMKRDLKHPV